MSYQRVIEQDADEAGILFVSELDSIVEAVRLEWSPNQVRSRFNILFVVNGELSVQLRDNSLKKRTNVSLIRESSPSPLGGYLWRSIMGFWKKFEELKFTIRFCMPVIAHIWRNGT